MKITKRNLIKLIKEQNHLQQIEDPKIEKFEAKLYSLIREYFPEVGSRKIFFTEIIINLLMKGKKITRADANKFNALSEKLFSQNNKNIKNENYKKKFNKIDQGT